MELEYDTIVMELEDGRTYELEAWPLAEILAEVTARSSILYDDDKYEPIMGDDSIEDVEDSEVFPSYQFEESLRMYKRDLSGTGAIDEFLDDVRGNTDVEELMERGTRVSEMETPEPEVETFRTKSE